MQYVKFNLDEYRYVLSIVDIVEIIPYVKLKPLAKLPVYVAGQCNYRGISIPVIDLCSLFLKRPCERKLSTRILIVDTVDNNPANKLVGLMVEKATEIIKVVDDDFMDASKYGEELPYAGPILADPAGFIYRLNTSDIFLRLDCKELFPDTKKSAWLFLI